MEGWRERDPGYISTALLEFRCISVGVGVGGHAEQGVEHAREVGASNTPRRRCQGFQGMFSG